MRAHGTTVATWALGSLLMAACGGGGSGSPEGMPPPAIDVTPPIVALAAPADFATGIAGTLTIRATATDDVGVAAVEVQVDGMPVAEIASEPYEVGVDADEYAAGQHIVRVRARDAAGNRSPWAGATVRFDGTSQVGAAFEKDDGWVTGLSRATAFAQAPDGRLFVCEQGGRLRIVKNGALLAAPFHEFGVDSAGERGLLGVALHPDFAANGHVYAYYTSTDGGTHNRISRLVANGDVSTGAETVLVDLPALSSATNHNGGALHFGADGMLYAAVGDNADGARAQDLDDVFGKMLRVDDDGGIPDDNPFCTMPGALHCAVWAYGLRNPYTFAVQPGTGRIHINDVGADAWEEIDLGAAGADYGWPDSEGADGIGSGVTAPLFSYAHDDASPPGSGSGGFFNGFAITGGTFYPESGNFPTAYHGSYFFADFALRWVARLDPADSGAAYAFGHVANNPVDMLAAADGALLVLTRSGVARFSVR